MNYPSIGHVRKITKAKYGVNLPAVTQILGKTGNSFDKFLEKLDKNIDVEEERRRVMNIPQIANAVSRGRKVAHALENGIMETKDENVNNVLAEMEKAMEGFDTIAKEASLVYKNQYCGIADLVGNYGGELVIADNKSISKKLTVGKNGEVRPSSYKGYGLQVCAYAKAHNDMFGTDIKTGVLFFVEGDGIDDEISHKIIEVDIDEYWDEFKYRYEDYIRRETILLNRQMQFYNTNIRLEA